MARDRWHFSLKVKLALSGDDTSQEPSRRARKPRREWDSVVLSSASCIGHKGGDGQASRQHRQWDFAAQPSSPRSGTREKTDRRAANTDNGTLRPSPPLPASATREETSRCARKGTRFFPRLALPLSLLRHKPGVALADEGLDAALASLALFLPLLLHKPRDSLAAAETEEGLDSLSSSPLPLSSLRPTTSQETQLGRGPHVGWPRRAEKVYGTIIHVSLFPQKIVSLLQESGAIATRPAPFGPSPQHARRRL